MFVLFLFLSLSARAIAAPMPLTSSSMVVSQHPGMYASPIGFSIHLGKAKWQQILPPKNNDYIETIYRSSKDENIQAALTVRTDKMETKMSLSQFSKKWMKDYPRFGFDILAAKQVKVGDNVGFMLDLINNDRKKQLRQLIFVKDTHAVTLTCRDDRASFHQTLKTCNEIIRTFSW